MLSIFFEIFLGRFDDRNLLARNGTFCHFLSETIFVAIRSVIFSSKPGKMLSNCFRDIFGSI